jgi:hypothetical protein
VTRGKTALHEEVEGEEQKAEHEETGTPEELKAMKLEDGVKKTGRDQHKTGFAAALVEGACGNIAGEAATECGEPVVHPESDLRTTAPQRESAESKCDVTEARQKTES